MPNFIHSSSWRSPDLEDRRQWSVSAIIASAIAKHVAGDWPVPKSGKSPLKPALPRYPSPRYTRWRLSRHQHWPGDVVFVRDIPATGDQYRATRHRRDVVVRLLRYSRSTCSWRTVMRIVRDTPWHTFGVRFRGNSKSYNFYKVPQSYLYCIIIVKRSSVKF